MPNHAAILTLIEQAYGGGDSVKTAHVTFRIAKPGGKLKKGLTPEICRQLLAQADLVQHPNSLRSLLGSLVEKDDLLNDTPWTTIDLYRDTRRARTTTWSANQAPDHWVSDPPWSLKWDSANSQMDLMRSTDDHEHHETLQKLFYPTAMTWTSIRSRLPDCEIRKDGESIVLDHWSRESHRRFTLDSTTGCVMSEASYINNLLEQENLQFGWKKLSEGFWLPSVIAHLIYSPEGLAECEFIIFDHTTVNTRLPEGVFELGAPPGSVIVDSRSGLKQVYSINRDVFDVTSDEQLKAAQTPLDEELTEIERIGVTDASRLYSLRNESVLKRVGPPFPLSRKFVSRMLGDRTVYRPGEISRLIEWNGSRFDAYFSAFGGQFSAGDLALRLTRIQKAELEGDEDLIQLPIPGDFVFRERASKEDLLNELQAIVSDEAGTAVTITFRDVERTVYTASGEFKLDLAEGRSLIDMNGGPHSGVSSEIVGQGNLTNFLRSLSAYINLKIISNVKPGDDVFRWSARTYDLDSTNAADRFPIDPSIVLKQITKQTGIQFTEEKQLLKVLFVERKSPVD